MFGGELGLVGVEFTEDGRLDYVSLGAGELAEAGGLDGDGGEAGNAGGETRGVALLGEEAGEGEAEGADLGVETGVGGGVAHGAAEGAAEDGGEAARFKAGAEGGEGVFGLGGRSFWR